VLAEVGQHLLAEFVDIGNYKAFSVSAPPDYIFMLPLLLQF